MSDAVALERLEKWDRRYLDLARYVSQWSKDPSTKAGAVVVDPSRNRVVSVGYNGFAPGGADDGRLHDRETKYQMTVHCERNAVVSACRDVTGFTLYTWPFFGCTPCGAMMLCAGIRRAVAPELSDHLKERWEADLERAVVMWREASAEVVIYPGVERR